MNEQDSTVVIGEQAAFSHELEDFIQYRAGVGGAAITEPVQERDRAAESKDAHGGEKWLRSLFLRPVCVRIAGEF